jgi:hypothetical protein
MWLTLNIGTIIQSLLLRRRYLRDPAPEDAWVAPFALALAQGHIIYMIGSFFVGIAYQPFVFMLIALQIGAKTYMARKEKSRGWSPIMAGAAR